MTGVLPSGWASVAVEDLADVVTGATPLRSNEAYYRGGTVPWVTSGALNYPFVDCPTEWITEKAINDTNAKLLPAGSLLVAMYGEGKTRGRVSELRINAATNQACAALIFSGISVAARRYVKLYFEDSYYRLRTLASGGVQPNLNLSLIKKTVVPLPPLDEQRRIVEAIEEQLTRLDAAVAGLKRVRQQLRRYRASVLKAACEGRLVPTEAELARAEGREYEPADRLLERILAERRAHGGPKYKEPRPPSVTESLIEPEGWTSATVEQVSSLVTDGDHNPPKRVPTGIPHLTAKNVKRWQLTLEGCTYVTPSDYERTRTRFDPRPGDLIVTCVGTVGQTAVIPEGLTFSADRNLAGIRTLPGMHVRMLQIVLNAPYWEARIAGASGATAQPHLYLGDLRALPVPLPPRAEQERIVAEVERRLSVVEKAEAAVEANLKRAERMRQAILKRAFEGKLVPQDPNDEPASVLLERIWAERAGMAVNGRGRRGRRGSGQLRLPLNGQ